MNISHKIQTSLKQNAYLGIQISTFLEISKPEFWKLVKEIENHPVFRKLYSSKFSDEKIISLIPRHPVLLLGNNHQISQENNKINSIDMENLLQGHEIIVEKLKKLGKDRFISLFFDEEAFTPVEIAELTGLSLNEVQKFYSEVIDKIFINNMMNNFSPDSSPCPSKANEIIGVVDTVDNNPTLFSVSEKHRYKIYKDRLAVMIKKNKFPPDEIKEIYELIHKMELINTRLNLVSQIAQIIFDTQQNYLKTGDNNFLNVLEEKQVAEFIDVHSSWVSRIIQEKSILTTWGEKELRFFFISKREERKQKGLRVLSSLLKLHQHEKISDFRLSKELQKDYDIKISRRTVNIWCHELVKKNYDKKFT